MPATAGRRVVPWRTLVVVAAALAVAAAPGAPGRLAWHREALAAGEWWRLWTGHLVHASPYHLVWNVLPLLALGLLWEDVLGRTRQRGSGRGDLHGFWSLLAVSATVVGLGLLPLDPALTGYVGLSGVLNGIWVGGALLAARHERAAGNRLTSALLVAVVALSLGKIAFESLSGAPLFTDPTAIGAAAVPLAHALGALGGILWLPLHRATAESPGSARPAPALT